MRKEFKVFKQGITDNKVIILSKNGEYFKKKSKIDKYLYLGYEVFDMQDNKISN